MSVNSLPLSTANFTYVFVPKDTVKNLLDHFQKPFPSNFTPNPATLEPGDEDWPSNVNQSATLVAGKSLSHPFKENTLTRTFGSGMV
jgi:hypothetical protein